MNKILIFGHKKPDTDSVTSAISLSYLKNELGLDTEPRVLGDINNETKWVLDYFNIPVPKYLNDVKLKIKDVNYRKGCFIHKNNSILKAFDYMNNNGISTIPVVKDSNIFEGALSMIDIARNQVNGNFIQIKTKYDFIKETINGTEIVKIDDEIIGNIKAAYYKSSTFIDNELIDSNTILIVGDRHNIIDYAITNKAKLVIITGGKDIEETQISKALQNGVNIIKTDKDSFNTSVHIGLANYISTIPYNQEFYLFSENDFVHDLNEVSDKKRYSYYPVVEKDGECLGLIKLADLSDVTPKEVILVDHNESNQSVDGLDEAKIIEIIDHHKIGNIGSTIPINFRNMPVGSTNTIINLIYKENNISIPKNIAGIMLAGIISDTLLLNSPTTTSLDKSAVNELAKIADIDYQSYGINMFKAGTSLKGKTKEEIIYSDFKNFEIDDNKVGVSQVFVIDPEEILNEKEAYINLLNKIKIQSDYYMVTLFITDILKKESYIFYNDNAQELLENAFGVENLTQAYLLPNIVSRKKQIIPVIMSFIDKK